MSLASSAVRGAAWTVATGLVSRFLGLVGTLVLTRFLAPHVMGEVVTAAVIAFMASWATQLGINQYILVRVSDGDRSGAFHATVLSLAIAGIALTAVAIVGPGIGPWLESDKLHIYLPGMALAVFIRRVGGIPEKVLLRQLQFRTVSLATAIGELVYTLTAIGLVVLADLGGTAIVIGNIVQALTIAGINIAKCDLTAWLAPARLRWRKCKEILTFGLPLGIEAFLYEAARYGDKPLYTKFFGSARTGEYNLAYNLADLPATYVGEQVSNVLLPMLMRVEVDRRKNVLVRAVGLLVLVTLPMAIGLAVVSKTLVHVLLPESWHGVAPFLTILAAVSVFRPVNGFISQYLLSFGRNKALMLLEFLRVTILFGGIASLSVFGAVPAATAVGFAAFAHTVGLVYSIQKDGDFVKQLLLGIRAPLLGCLVMAFSVLAVRALVGPAEGPWVAGLLVLEIIVGIVAYGFSMYVFGRDKMIEAIGLVRSAIGR